MNEVNLSLLIIIFKTLQACFFNKNYSFDQTQLFNMILTLKYKIMPCFDTNFEIDI